MKTILICGGRDYHEYHKVAGVLDELAQEFGPLKVVQGGASGADEAARRWSMQQKPEKLWCLVNEPADWKGHGKRAGPIRNQKMLDEHSPDLVVAFPGGAGTRDMITRAVLCGVKVRHVE